MKEQKASSCLCSFNLMLHFIQKLSTGLVLRLGFITGSLCDMEEVTCPIELSFSSYQVGVNSIGLYLFLLQMTYYVQK